MVQSITSDQVVVINSQGQRRVITAREFEQKNALKENSSNNLQDYKYDVNWYLSHGFKEAKKVFKEIETDYTKQD